MTKTFEDLGFPDVQHARMVFHNGYEISVLPEDEELSNGKYQLAIIKNGMVYDIEHTGLYANGDETLREQAPREITAAMKHIQALPAQKGGSDE